MDAPSAPPLRLFLGLWPAPDVLAAVQQHADGWHWSSSARRTRPERLHVTLHFIGDVDAARLPELQEKLEVAPQRCDLVLDRAGVWPGGIAVLEAGAVPAELARLHAALGDRLVELGMPVESRRYRPHVTLARKAFGARPPAQWEPLRWPVQPAYRLVRSLPGGRGYEPLRSFG